MQEHCSHQNNIVLEDYNYQRDIDNRLLMADLTQFEVNVLREVIDGPLQFSIKKFANQHGKSVKEVTTALQKLGQTGLFSFDGDNVTVDKEMRKYYRSQIIKFEDGFEPGIEFLQGMLSKVPLHALLHWYTIPPSTDNIITAIIKHYLATPKTYEHYRNQLKFNDSVLNSIMKEVFAAPDYKVRAVDLMEKYNLPRQQFEEYMLALEYHFICCLSYRRVKDRWEEVVTPFNEWHNYLRFQQATTPCCIDNVAAIERFHPQDFGFVCDMAELLEMAQDDEVHPDTRSDYVVRLLDSLEGLHLASMDDVLNLLPGAREWLKKSRQEQALTVYRYAMGKLRHRVVGSSYTERDINEVERSLRPIAKQGWIYFEDFWKGFTAPIGNVQPVTLQNKGKKWWYELPKYSAQDRDFVYAVIFEVLFESGMVAIGTHRNRPCFCITPLGKISF